MTKRFPKFNSHEEASCFNCGGDFGDGYWRESGCGAGQFEQHCCKCDHFTYYDLERLDAPSSKTGEAK
jgi:hypothetical protein